MKKSDWLFLGLCALQFWIFQQLSFVGQRIVVRQQAGIVGNLGVAAIASLAISVFCLFFACSLLLQVMRLLLEEKAVRPAQLLLIARVSLVGLLGTFLSLVTTNT